MASRLVTQLRGLIVSANQVVIPVVADAKETNASYVKELYVKSFSIVLFFDILLITAIILFTPLVSYLWIGSIVPFFIFAVVLNCIVVFINILSNPAYFSYLGEGKLNWLIYSYLAISLLNPVLGFLLGSLLPGYGVVIAWNVSFLVSSVIILVSYNKTNNIRLNSLISREDFKLLFISLIVSCSGFLFLYIYLESTIFNVVFIAIFVLSLILMIKTVLNNHNFKAILIYAKELLVKSK